MNAFHRSAALLGLLLLSGTALAQAPAGPRPFDPLESDWKPIPDDEIMIIALTGNRTVVVRLAARFAPAHVANIRTLAHTHWWDGSSIYRVQENWVAQWGDPTNEKKLPDGITESPPAEFEIGAFTPAQTLAKHDAYSTQSGVTADGWPIAGNGSVGWLTHCYGTVGVARDALPHTGSGAALFSPIGQTARRLDRNYTVVGRIIEGMKYMSSLPRSDATMGVYADAKERTGIVSVRLASDLPAAERPHFQYRSTDNVRFAAQIAARENPPGMVAPGGVDVCDVQLTIRRAP